MYLLEQDAKQILASHGVPVPQGCVLTDPARMPQLPPGPWVVKGQITAGGRGKAGLIQKAATPAEVRSKAAAMLGRELNTRTVRAVRVEQQVGGASEAYIGMMLDPAAAGVRIIMTAQGGMDVEALPRDALQVA
ncbi:MAG: ATP-grasp domain-containing protein, partial [Burkholderiales bacterium]